MHIHTQLGIHVKLFVFGLAGFASSLLQTLYLLPTLTGNCPPNSSEKKKTLITDLQGLLGSRSYVLKIIFDLATS